MANRGGEDYLDKALDQAEKFAGKKVTLQHLTCTYTIAPCMLACDVCTRQQTTDMTRARKTVRPPRRLGKVQEAERKDHGQAALDVREGDGQEGEVFFDCIACLRLRLLWCRAHGCVGCLADFG